MEKFYDRIYSSFNDYQNYDIDNNGISCQFLYYEKYSKNVIACSYQITKKNNKKQLVISTFDIKYLCYQLSKVIFHIIISLKKNEFNSLFIQFVLDIKVSILILQIV